MSISRQIRRFRIIALLLCLSVQGPAGAAGWVAMGGPLGGLGYDVRIHPENKSIMYVTDNFAGVSKSTNAGQDWSPTNSGITTKGGTAGDAVNIFSLTIDPNNADTLWAGTFGDGQNFGVFKSGDAGATWTRKTNGMALDGNFGLIFRGFTIQRGNSNVVYAQAEVRTTPFLNGWQFFRSKGRVYKTVDGGENWQLIWEGNALARYLIIDPGDPNTLYVSHGIFDIEPFDSDCKNGVFAGVGVLKSSDGGQSWASLNNGLTDPTVNSLRMHPSNSQILFAATGNIACSGFNTPNFHGGVFKTSDGGATWTKVLASKNGEPFTAVNFSPSNPNTVYAGSPQAFYRSDDLGTTWTQHQRSGGFTFYGPPGIAGGIPIDVVVDPDNSDTVYVNNYAGGIFRSLDGTANWQTWSSGYTGDGVRRMALSGGNRAALAVIGKSGPFVSPNFGKDWKGLFNGDVASKSGNNWQTLAVHPANPNLILLADSNIGAIFRSTDNGSSFTQVFKDPNATTLQVNNPQKFQGFRGIAFAPSNPSIVYAGVCVDTHYYSPTPTGTVIYKSVDSGATFAAAPSIIDGYNVNRLSIDPSNANAVYAATSNGVYKTADGATNWTFFSSLGNKNIEGLAVNSGYLVAGEVNGGIWTSPDDGATWTGPHNTGINSPNPSMFALVFDPSNSSTIYAGDIYSGVYRSNDKGLTWSPFPDAGMSGLTMRAINDLAITSDVLYAGTEGGGVFRYDFSAVTTTPTVPAGLTATATNPSQAALNWAASSDSVGVTGYQIYRNNQLVGSTSQTSYTDTGLTAATAYRYSVAACDAAATCSAQSGAVAATTPPSPGPLLNLVSGWNLLGNSVDAALNVGTAFGSASNVASVWQWNAAARKWGFYTPAQADGGAAYAASRGYDSLTSIGGGQGFWVNAVTGFALQLPGGTAVTSAAFRSLPSGWNLIALGDNPTPAGFNSALSAAAPSPGATPANFTSLWAWDSTSGKWYFYSPSLDTAGNLASFIAGKGYLDFSVGIKTLQAGMGFWVNRQ